MWAFEHSFRPFRAAACVCFRQSSCLPAVGKSGCLSACRQCVPSTAWPLFRVVEFRVAVRLSGSLAKYRRQLSGYPAVRLPRRPGHVASRRLVGARHSVPLLRESVLATAQKRSSAPVPQGADSSGHGFRASVWPWTNRRAFRQTAELLGGWVSRQCARPGDRRFSPWGVPSSLPSVGPQS